MRKWERLEVGSGNAEVGKERSWEGEKLIGTQLRADSPKMES